MGHMVKIGLLIACLVCAVQGAEEWKCNLRYCGAELLNFEDHSFSNIFTKLQLANFCVKNCTPTVVREFFESLMFGITKRIPGLCHGNDCVDKNRFVALAKCVEERAWPLLQCSKRLIDLAHIGLLHNPAEEKRNTTCGIATETVQCIEEILQNCGEVPFQLLKEVLGDLIKVGIKAYCHPAYRHEGFFIKKKVTPTPAGDEDATATTEGPFYKHPQFVKGYRTGGAGFLVVSNVCLLSSVVLSVLLSTAIIK